MLNYLPDDTKLQVLKNIMYIENRNKVQISQRSILFDYIMKNYKLPKITPTGYILK